MDGNVKELFQFCEYAVKTTGWPYVSFILQNDVIISRDMNLTRQKLDPSLQCSVSAVRSAQISLETNDLSSYTLLSMFEPTILSFDVALWAGIKKLRWCINASSAPEHYHNMSYRPKTYLEHHPGKISIQSGLYEKEALDLIHRLRKDGDFVNTVR